MKWPSQKEAGNPIEHVASLTCRPTQLKQNISVTSTKVGVANWLQQMESKFIGPNHWWP